MTTQTTTSDLVFFRETFTVVNDTVRGQVRRGVDRCQEAMDMSEQAADGLNFIVTELMANGLRANQREAFRRARKQAATATATASNEEKAKGKEEAEAEDEDAAFHRRLRATEFEDELERYDLRLAVELARDARGNLIVTVRNGRAMGATEWQGIEEKIERALRHSGESGDDNDHAKGTPVNGLAMVVCTVRGLGFAPLITASSADGWTAVQVTLCTSATSATHKGKDNNHQVVSSEAESGTDTEVGRPPKDRDSCLSLPAWSWKSVLAAFFAGDEVY